MMRGGTLRSASRLMTALLVLGASSVALAQSRGIPARIVSTSPSTTETLFALDLGDRVVGVSSFCRYPPSVKTLPRVGTFRRSDAETIARLRPELVILHAGSMAVPHLAALGINTALVERGALPGVFTRIREIGNAAGVPDRADRLVADLTAGLARVRASVAGRPPRKVLIIVGRQAGTLSNLVAVGPGSYLHDVAATAGGVNVLASVPLEYPRISMETVIRLAPEVIIDVGETGESPDDAEQRRQVTEELWRRRHAVGAVRARAVYATNDDAFVVAGPRIVTVAQLMAAWFHGDQTR